MIFFTGSIFANAQLAGKKFKLSMEQNGMFYLEFKKATYELTNPMGDIAVKGNYKIEKDFIEFTDIEGQMACPEDYVGKYRFTFENKVLKMVLIDDPCIGRPNMALKPWNLVEK